MAQLDVGRYKIVEEIGRGAMGVVYRATDPAIHRTVAVKVINESYLETVGVKATEYFERFRREAETAGRLNHPNIVKIFDLGPRYIVMEFVEGESLAALIRSRKRLPLSKILHLVTEAADALDYAHRQNVVHRDVKPANLMIQPDGVVKIMDFGLARIESSTLTAAGEVLGSAAYMPPEVIMGRPADARSDIFSLGVVAYELMTGDRPFGGGSISTVIWKILQENPPPARQLNMSLPPDYDDILGRVLAKDPNARFASAGDFANALVLKKWGDDHEAEAGTAPTTAETLLLTRGIEGPIEDDEGLGETTEMSAAEIAALEVDRAAETAARLPPPVPAAPMASLAPTPPLPPPPPRSEPLTEPLDLGMVPTRPPPQAVVSPDAAVRRPVRWAIMMACAVLAIAGLVAARWLVHWAHSRQAEPESATETPSTPLDRVASASEAPPPSVPDRPEASTAPPERAAAPEEAPDSPPPAPPVPATLSVTSIPAGAQVTIGKRPLGTTPLRLEMPPGKLTVEVTKDGFKPWSRQLSVRSGTRPNLAARLQPLAEASLSPRPPPPVRRGDLVEMTPDVTPPKKLSGDNPSLPRGVKPPVSVTVEYVVTEEGRVADARILESGGAALDRACLEFVSRWRFEPAEKQGVQVKVTRLNRFTFQAR